MSRFGRSRSTRLPVKEFPLNRTAVTVVPVELQEIPYHRLSHGSPKFQLELFDHPDPLVLA